MTILSPAYQYNTVPSYATKITVCICNLSLNGSNSTLVQLGTSSGLITSDILVKQLTEKDLNRLKQMVLVCIRLVLDIHIQEQW